MRNNCFVCGNTRLDFSKLAISFDSHISTDHDPWKYIYYILYLEKKGENELSGLEYFAWTQIQNKKTGWIPIGNTQYIQSDKTEQLKQLDEKLSKLEHLTASITHNLSEICTGADLIIKEKRIPNHRATVSNHRFSIVNARM